MVDLGYVQDYLYQHIPLSKAMKVQVLEVTNNQVHLKAPLAPNINHRETVFGGSASALAILSAWSLVHFRLQSENFPCRVVIQNNEMSYDKAILDDFEAICALEDEQTWIRFKKILLRKGKARIKLESRLLLGGQTVGSFTGSFVALHL